MQKFYMLLDQDSLKSANETFLNNSKFFGYNSDSLYFGKEWPYIIGDNDLNRIKNLEDEDDQKIDIQKSTIASVMINGVPLKWLEEAYKVENLMSVDSQSVKVKDGNIFAIATLSYRQLFNMMQYSKDKKEDEIWGPFREEVKTLPYYNELIAKKAERIKTKEEKMQEQEVQKLLEDIKIRKEKANERKEKWDNRKKVVSEKIQNLREKIAIWEIKAIINSYFTMVSVKNSLKKGAIKVWEDGKQVASKVKTKLNNLSKPVQKEERIM